MVRQLANLEEFNQLKADNPGKAIIIDFTASWCGPCKMIGPKFVAMEAQFPSVIFVKVDVDEADDISEQCGISAMPTFHVYKDGNKVDELVGASEEKLRAMVQKYA